MLSVVQVRKYGLNISTFILIFMTRKIYLHIYNLQYSFPGGILANRDNYANIIVLTTRL